MSRMDPHNDEVFWEYRDGKILRIQEGQADWEEPGWVRITPERILMLARLIQDSSFPPIAWDGEGNRPMEGTMPIQIMNPDGSVAETRMADFILLHQGVDHATISFKYPDDLLLQPGQSILHGALDTSSTDIERPVPPPNTMVPENGRPLWYPKSEIDDDRE